MAKSLENSTLIQHLDKISYGVAGALALAIFLVAFQSGGEVRRLQADIQENMSAVDLRKGEKIPETPVPDLRKEIEFQWSVSAIKSPYVAWTTERIPSIAKWFRRGLLKAGSQEAGKIVKAEYHRSAEKLKTYVKVFGKFGGKKEARFIDVRLSRKEIDAKGGDKPYRDLPGLDKQKALKDEAFEYEDFDVEAGKKYAYKFSTEIEAARVDDPSNKKIDSPDAILTSAVPFDYQLNIIHVEDFDPQKGTRPMFLGDIRFANFEDESGESIKAEAPADSKGYPEKFVFGPKFGKDRLYQIKTIGDQKVIIYNYKTRTSESWTSRDRPDIKLPAAIDFTIAAPAPDAAAGDAGTADAVANTGETGTEKISGKAAEKAPEKKEPEKKPPEKKEPPKKEPAKKPDTTKKKPTTKLK